MKWVGLVALPMLALWVIGLPLLALIILIRNRKNLNKVEVQSYFLILYQGFKDETFYWEFVSALRKFVLLAIHSLLNTFSVNYKVFASVGEFSYSNILVSLIFFYNIQKIIQPFKNKDNNSLDLQALVMGTVTIFTGTIFGIENDVHSAFYNLSILIDVLFNGYFLMNWTFAMMLALEWKNPTMI